MALRILGVDPGVNITGFGIIESQAYGRFSCLHTSAVKTPKRLPLAQRLAILYDAVQQVLTSHKPTRVAVETVFTGRNPRSAIVLAHVRAAPLIAAARRGLPVAEYQPATIKRQVSGYGRAGKEQVKALVMRVLQVQDGLCQDCYDALAIALCDYFSAGRHYFAKGPGL